MGYDGCCSGQAVYWCAAGKLANLDCAANTTLTACGYSEEKQVIDCVPPESGGGDQCPFGGGDVVIGADVTEGGPDGGSLPDVAGGLDGVAVPDVNAPAECASLAAAYTVDSTDCGGFGTGFLPKQEGCAMVLVGLLAGQDTHPSGWATVSGIAFQYLDAGKDKQCMGQFVQDSVEGKCYWGESECEFKFLKVAEPEEPGPTNGGSGGSGGCSITSGAGAERTGWVLLLVLIVGLLLLTAVLPVSDRVCGRVFRAVS